MVSGDRNGASLYNTHDEHEYKGFFWYFIISILILAFVINAFYFSSFGTTFSLPLCSCFLSRDRRALLQPPKLPKKEFPHSE